jgi:hypothetical protein
MSENTFVPVNPLEDCLLRAATDPSARPEFYRLLLESEIYFLTPTPPKEPGQYTAEADTQLELVHLPGKTGNIIPFFSSLQRLQEMIAASGAKYGFVAFRGRDAFNILTQSSTTAVLNPGLAFGKEFLPEEMQRLADGSFFETNEKVIGAGKQILLGQPAVYPHDLVKALQRLFERQPSVSAAYLAQVHDPSSGDPPHIMIGIECPGSMRVVAPEAVLVAQEVMKGATIVDFIEVGSGKGSLDAYFKTQTQPFFKRTASKPRWKFW